MRRVYRIGAWFVLGVGGIAMSSQVHAAMPPATYVAKAKGNSVTICPDLLNKRECPQPAGLLRQDLATGAVVRLGPHCTDERVLAPGVLRSSHRGTCYLDECVPPGRYRYGYAKPLACMGSGSRYYAEVTVTRPLPPDCQRAPGTAAPTSHARVPWSKSPWVCTRSGCGCSTAATPSPSTLLVLAALGLGLLAARRRRR